MASGQSSVATSSSTKKKKKNLVKSLVKGLSFKKKKKFVDDDTVVGVAVDSNDGPSATAAFSEKPTPPVASAAKPIQVVLLLMDPNSRRFELLQLEFDSNTALVSDVVRQIQLSATENSLRNLKYEGVCDQDGLEMVQSFKLSNFCKRNDIVLAIPKGMNGKMTVEMAQPILSDSKVADMLRPCGVKIKNIIKPPKKQMEKIAEEDSTEKTTEKKVTTTPEKTRPPKSKPTSKTSIVFGMGIMALLFFTILRHIRVTKKIQSGDILLPGQWKSQCGIWDILPKKLSEKYCNSKSSTLEMGRDGTLRYFTKSADSEKSESWSLSGSGAHQCADGGESNCAAGDDGQNSVTFVKDGFSWYVDMDGKRTTLGKNVVQDFMSV